VSEAQEQKIAELEQQLIDEQNDTFAAQAMLAYVLKVVGEVTVGPEVVADELNGRIDIEQTAKGGFTFSYLPPEAGDSDE